ncbi:alpha/beta fold hydrolase [Candidatus Roseilinea sp. NK_OTU-006]|nr:alpha/beta fold hydrolase [Candidatus Roseilinea sp. NK_OTU-006]
MSHPYPGPMQPAPQLAPHARTLRLQWPDGAVQYFEAGAPHAPAIVLIHGLQDEADTWRHVFERLAQTHHVIALDLPGFGRSDKARRRYSVPFYTRVVLGLMDALKIGYATLIGSSLGAMIAETIALTQPARASGLVLIGGTIHIVERPAAAPRNLVQLLRLAANDRRYFEALRRSPQAAYDSLRPYYANLDDLPQTDRDFLFQRVNERVWDEAQRLASLSVQMNLPIFLAFQGRALIRRIPASAVPTTVIWGAEDRILPMSNGIARTAIQRASRWIRIEAAGHLPHQEKPEDFLRAIAPMARTR